MRKTFPILWVILLIFFGWESGSWSAPLRHDFVSTENAEITGQPVQSTLRLPRACARGMLRVDPERGLSTVEGSNEDHEDFEKQLRSLLKDLEKLEKEAKDKMTKEILPYLRQEIERIKKWLKEFRLEKEKEEPPERRRI